MPIISNATTMEIPRGIRNHNAGNLRPNDWKKWPGATGADDEGYVIFKRPIDGLRAIVINLRIYKTNYRINTVQDIINRWTNDIPAKDRVGYIKFVSSRLEVNPTTKLNMNNPKIIKQLAKAIIFFENGQDPYSDKIYKRIFPTVIDDKFSPIRPIDKSEEVFSMLYLPFNK